MKKINALRKPFYIVILVIFLAGCTHEADSDFVVTLTDDYFSAIKQQDYDKVLSFYSDDFFKITTKQGWLEYLKDVNNKLGSLQTIKIKQSQINTIFSGRRFFYEFTNQYENGTAKETLVLFQPVEKDEVKIQAHKIESKQL